MENTFILKPKNTKDAQRTILGHGVYYLLSGIWPIVSMRSFERVTGPKTDKWLVKTVGVLVTVIGGTLIYGSLRDAPTSPTRFLARASAIGLAAIDGTYVLKRRISPIYLLDAVVEVCLAALACKAEEASNQIHKT
jgi:hypothetical protein